MRQTNYATYNAVRVACPFYKGEAARDVRCEGLLRGGALVNHFPTIEAKAAYMRARCYRVKGCEGCPIHRMMTAVWAGREK